MLALAGGCDRVGPCPPVGSSKASPAASSITIVSPQDVATLQASGRSAVVLDVNPREIYDEGHVPGARWMSFDTLDRGLLPEDRAVPVVVYCYNPTCGASHQAAEKIAAAGWKDVRRMSAGIRGWQAAGLPVEAGR